MNNKNSPGDGDGRDPRVARREKMRQIAERGIDPFGSRFDDRVLIGQCRQRAGEVKFVKEDGTQLELPDFDAGMEAGTL